MGISNLFGLLGDDDDSGYSTNVLSDLDIDGDGSIGSKPISDYDPSQEYNFGTFPVANYGSSGVSPSMDKQDSTGSLFTDSRFLSAALQSGLGLAGMAFSQSAQRKALEQAAADKRNQALMELELEKLKYKYGLKGGSGGGGRGGGGGSQRGAQLLNAYQNYIQGVQSINQNQQGSIRNLGNAIASGYAAGRR